jgi:fatty-acyl-CoA synthase
MKGYYKNPEATSAVIDVNGWLHTGDLAVLDERGYFKITGRAKDVIIRGGENVYPREVEDFLYSCPLITEAQIIGIPDIKYGEEIVAWLKLKPDAQLSLEELQQFCKGKIADYKIPRFLKIVDSFPMTVTGKIQKFVMRETSTRELGRSNAQDIATA